VLITPHVGDFSSLVAENGVGAVVSDDGRFDPGIVNAVADNRQAFAARSMEAGKQLSWDAWRSAWTSIIESLTA
jgi:hypothetical protein